MTPEISKLSVKLPPFWAKKPALWFGQAEAPIRAKFVWLFIIADVATPIVGINFLAYYNLSVDAQKNLLTDTTTSLSAKSIQPNLTMSGIKTISSNSKYLKILAEFSDLTWPAGFPKKKTNLANFTTYTPRLVYQSSASFNLNLYAWLNKSLKR